MKAEEEPILVKCFGLEPEKVKDIGKVADVIIPRSFPEHPHIRTKYTKSVTIFNDKTGEWEAHGLVDYIDKCPSCGKLMRVQAVWGTSWLACCSEECYKKYIQKQKGRITT